MSAPRRPIRGAQTPSGGQGAAGGAAGPGLDDGAGVPGNPGDPRLVALGLRRGEAVRWQEAAGGRWRTGTVHGAERDGSIAVAAATGAARSLPVERLWVGVTGRRGGRSWEPLTVRAARAEQLSLLALLDAEPARRGRLGYR